MLDAKCLLLFLTSSLYLVGRTSMLFEIYNNYLKRWSIKGVRSMDISARACIKATKPDHVENQHLVHYRLNSSRNIHQGKFRQAV